MSNLKPCPFCGGSAHISRAPCVDGGGFYAFVKCSKCGAKSRECYYTNGNDCPIFYQNICDKWNTRTYPSDAAIMEHPKVKALVDAVETFSEMAGEMFSRNWNDDGVAISLVGKNGTMRLTFKDFRKLRLAISELKGILE